MPHKKITHAKNNVNMLDMKKSRTFKNIRLKILCAIIYVYIK